MDVKHIGYILAFVFFSACHYDVGEELDLMITCSEGEVSFTRDVIPIMETHCISCHNDQQAQGGVNLDGYAQIIVYANDNSLLGSIQHDPQYVSMPLNAGKLDSCDIKLIARWITQGAIEN